MITIAADFLTGLFHWAEDAYCTRGRLFNVCDDNIYHHLKPNAIAWAGNLFTRNQSLIVLGVIGLVIGLVWFPYWQWFTTVFIAICGNETHRINHTPTKKLNWFESFLSNSGLIQSRQQHNRHHTPPFDRHYCTITSFTNEVLELIRFWPSLEWLIKVASFGLIVPKRMTAERNGV